MPSRAGRCAVLSTLLAAAVLSFPARAQNPRVDIKRFQWDPVVVHLAAEASLGVEMYLSVQTTHWGLTWIRPDTLAAWLPQLHALLSSSASSDSTTWVRARGGAAMRVVKGTVQGRQAFALQLSAPPMDTRLDAWLPGSYLADLTKALDKSVAVARDLERAPQSASAQPVYEEWDVDSLPVGASEQRGFLLPTYMKGGAAVVGFVVDSAGRVVPSSVTVYDCDDANLARQWAREVVAWTFAGGMRDDHRVATRVRAAYTLEQHGSFQVNNPRVIPGRP